MRSILAFAVVAALSAGAAAQTPASDPAGASAPATAPKEPTKADPQPAAKAGAPSSAQMTAMTKSMQEMHDKMMAAKTPEERQALMAKHMKAMQDGMAMMGQMKGGTGMGGSMSTSPEMMASKWT